MDITQQKCLVNVVVLRKLYRSNLMCSHNTENSRKKIEIEYHNAISEQFYVLKRIINKFHFSLMFL